MHRQEHMAQLAAAQVAHVLLRLKDCTAGNCWVSTLHWLPYQRYIAEGCGLVGSLTASDQGMRCWHSTVACHMWCGPWAGQARHHSLVIHVLQLLSDKWHRHKVYQASNSKQNAQLWQAYACGSARAYACSEGKCGCSKQQTQQDVAHSRWRCQVACKCNLMQSDVHAAILIHVVQLSMHDPLVTRV